MYSVKLQHKRMKRVREREMESVVTCILSTHWSPMEFWWIFLKDIHWWKSLCLCDSVTGLQVGWAGIGFQNAADSILCGNNESSELCATLYAWLLRQLILGYFYTRVGTNLYQTRISQGSWNQGFSLWLLNFLFVFLFFLSKISSSWG